jgi:sigma-B regulation protein RsbU (phosphoserine phosphatase)
VSTPQTAAMEHPCTRCDGVLEPELVSIYPSSDVCLDCLAKTERQRLEKELNQVQALDRSLLSHVPDVKGWDVGLHYRPSRLLSGDFYDVRHDANGRLTLLIGDVMGKGIPAALLRAGLQSSLKALAPEVCSPADVLRKANGHFVDNASPGRLASVFLGALDTDRGELRYANGGHLPPLLRRASGEWRTLDATGMVLGALPDVAYSEAKTTIDPGDLLVMFSDGFTEAENSAGDIFDEREMTRRIDALPGMPAQVLASSLAEELAVFAPGEPSDDRTLLMLRRT